MAWPPRSQTSNSRPDDDEEEEVDAPAPLLAADDGALVGATTRSTLQPSVGVVETVSPRWRRYRIDVFPALSRPTWSREEGRYRERAEGKRERERKGKSSDELHWFFFFRRRAFVLLVFFRPLSRSFLGSPSQLSHHLNVLLETLSGRPREKTQGLEQGTERKKSKRSNTCNRWSSLSSPASFFIFFALYHHYLVLLAREHPVPQAREDDAHLAKARCVEIERASERASERERERERERAKNKQRKKPAAVVAERGGEKKVGSGRNTLCDGKTKPKHRHRPLLHCFLSPLIRASFERKQSRCSLCYRLSSLSRARSMRGPGWRRIIAQIHQCR